MRLNAALIPRDSIPQRVRGILAAPVLVFVALLFSTRPVLAQSGDVSLAGDWRTILGPVEVHLVFTDTSGKQQDYSLAEAPADVIKKLTPRLQAESKLPLLQPKVRYFDGQWLQNGAKVCKEVVADIQQRFPAGATNTAYDVSCRPFKYGFMSAYIDPKAASYFVQYNSQGAEIIPVGGFPTSKVMQLQIELSVPLNIVPFTLTTSCTCHTSNLTCNKDPDFTMAFDASFVVVANSTELGSMKFGPRPQMSIEYYIGSDAVGMTDGKAFEKNVAQLEAQLEVQLVSALATLAATGDLSVLSLVADLFYDLAKYGIGGLYEATCDANLSSAVSANLAGEFNTTTVIKMANQASAAFKTLFLAVGSGSDIGFTQLDVVEGSDHSLEFRLTYPTPAKPDLINATLAANKGIHLSPPSIGTGGQEVTPGVPFLVNGNNFPLPSANALDLSWNRTIAGVGHTQLEWGPKGGVMQTIPVAAAAYRFANLKPETAYQFRVQECDALSCSPWSDWLEASTQSGGSGIVKLWLDGNTAQQVGTAAVGPAGGFVVKATIPAGVTAGNHTLNAGTNTNKPEASVQITGDHTRNSAADLNKPEASVQITVTGPGGSGGAPTIAVMNTMTHTAYPPPPFLLYPSTFTLRGNGFAPGATVTVHLDTDAGAQLGTAIPNKAGIFQGSFNLPMTSTGPHKLVAVQVQGGGTVQASENVNTAGQPQ
jgi:hypothetical protein